MEKPFSAKHGSKQGVWEKIALKLNMTFKIINPDGTVRITNADKLGE